MIWTAFVLGSVLTAATPDPTTDAPTGDQAAYQEAKARAGRNPDANVRLALWCEAHGLEAERVKHLASAVLHDPTHAAARGLLGLVAYRGHWRRPEQVAEAARSDEALQAAMAEYNGRREGMPETADAHWALGLWCEQKGLTPEATAHFTAVTRLAPGRADAWKKLGFRRVGGRWVSDAQADAERSEADARRRAEARWAPRLKDWWKGWLAEKDRRPEVEASLAKELEPRAVPTIMALLGAGMPEQQRAAVHLLDRIDAPEATRALARFAACARSYTVRHDATEALARREPAEVIEPLVGQMHAPLGVDVTPGGGPGVVAELRVEGDEAILRKVYVQRTVRLNNAGRMGAGFLTPILSPRMTNRTAQQQLSRDLQAVRSRNVARASVSESARVVLADLTGEDLGPDPAVWKRWLSDRKGYAYERTNKPVITRVSQHILFTGGFHSNCFAKGTTVPTLLGPRPIETLRVGDQVLSEDTGTGALSYQPVVAVYHNPPSPTLRIAIDDEEIVATPIHRFWRAGRGWSLARDLKPGDMLRVLGGQGRVAAVTPDAVQPVFNLELADGHSFFVGRRGALVHDNSRMQAGPAPFDAATSRIP